MIVGFVSPKRRWVRFAKMHLALVSRAQRSTKWCAADPGPFQSVAVPDQRCTASLALALRRIRDTRYGRSLYFPVFLQIRNLPSPVSRSQEHTHLLLPAAHFAPGFFSFASLTPNRGVGGAPRNVRVRARHPCGVSCASQTRVNALMTRYARRLARRLASHDAGRSPLGAPPWRFWASGPRFRLLGRPPSYNGGQVPCGSVQRAPRTQVVVPGGRGSRTSRGERLRAARRRTPLPAPPSGSPPETPLNERGCEASSIASICSQ
jgi:hypothetical protein